MKILASSTTANELSSGEQGAVIPLVALLATIFVVFAAIVIDLNLLSSSREQTQHFARLAALAAINAHFSSASDDIDERIDDALNAARQVSNRNVILSDQKAGDIGFGSSLRLESDSGAGAVLTPGVWYPANDGTDPCERINKPYPCFFPWDGSSDQITAYKIEGSLYSGITTAIARRVPALGREAFPVDVEAVASVIPRQGCFIVDLSASMIRETMPRRGIPAQDSSPTGGRGREFAFFLDSENSTIANDFYHSRHWNWLCSGDADNPNPPAASCTYQSRPTNEAEWNTFLAPFGETYASLTTQEKNRIHFHDDYRRMKTLGDNDYDAGRYPLHPDPTSNPVYQAPPDGYWTRVHVHRDQDVTGPEPLRTVFLGLNRAMRAFRDRQVAGDQACLIMYDSTLAWPRIVNLTNDFDYLIEMTDIALAAPIADDDPATVDVTDPNARGLELIIRHMLFPGEVENAYTHTAMALSEAMNQLTSGNPAGGFSSDFIVSIGDGLGNCHSGGCSNQYGFFNTAQTENLAFVTNQIAGRNIPVHWIVVGNEVAPHTLDIIDPSRSDNRCLSDLEFRRRLPFESFVRGGWDTSVNPSGGPQAFATMSTENPFYQANVAPYEMAAGTRGLFGPLRPRADVCDTRCQNPDTCFVECTGSINNTASAPRLTVDPRCRTMDQQITEYMDQIIGDNPYTLVFVGERG